MATNLDDSMSVDSVHVDSASGSKPVAKKANRKTKSKASTKSGRRYRKGLNMKIGADGSMHVRHMGDDDKCVAIMPPVEIVLSVD